MEAEARARLPYDPRCRAHRRPDVDRGVLAEGGTCRQRKMAEVNLLEVLFRRLPGLESWAGRGRRDRSIEYPVGDYAGYAPGAG